MVDSTPISSFVTISPFHSHLEEFELLNTSMTMLQWRRFLQQLTMPMLEKLVIDTSVGFLTLSNFIQHHSTISELAV
jgi:hypothetical protein